MQRIVEIAYFGAALVAGAMLGFTAAIALWQFVMVQIVGSI